MVWPMIVHKYVDENSLAAMLATKGQQVSHQRWISGLPSVNKAAHSGFLT